uniref:Large ribosomal subunit protein mL49 n=1 Tax=Caenorhabditis tropicalis TaxID=1561998 RepID=A0A1I7V1M4_9PELO
MRTYIKIQFQSHVVLIATNACISDSWIVSFASLNFSSSKTEKLWENPWKHALPQKTKTLATVEEVPVDWSYVERLMPIEIVPDVPKHESYPTPSGWTPPTEAGKTHSYFVRRRPDHLLPLYLERKRDLLNEKTLDFDYVELVTVRNVDGDVFACEQDLRGYLEENLGHPVASHVDELKGRIKVKGAPRALIEQFFYSKGF